MVVNMGTPQGMVAQQFMENKGLTDVEPVEVDKVQGQPCWYFLYEMPEGDLELEVFWDADSGWEATVTTFTLDS